MSPAARTGPAKTTIQNNVRDFDALPDVRLDRIQSVAAPIDYGAERIIEIAGTADFHEPQLL